MAANNNGMDIDTFSSPSNGEVVDHRKRRRNRTTQSCLNCHTSKRKCDRKRPCQRCIQLGLTGLCVYEIDDPATRDDPTLDETTRLRNRIAELESLVRELRGKPHPRWSSPMTSTSTNPDPTEKWHSRATKSGSIATSPSTSPTASNSTFSARRIPPTFAIDTSVARTIAPPPMMSPMRSDPTSAVGAPNDSERLYRMSPSPPPGSRYHNFQTDVRYDERHAYANGYHHHQQQHHQHSPYTYHHPSAARSTTYSNDPYSHHAANHHSAAHSPRSATSSPYSHPLAAAAAAAAAQQQQQQQQQVMAPHPSHYSHPAQHIGTCPTCLNSPQLTHTYNTLAHHISNAVHTIRSCHESSSSSGTSSTGGSVYDCAMYHCVAEFEETFRASLPSPRRSATTPSSASSFPPNGNPANNNSPPSSAHPHPSPNPTHGSNTPPSAAALNGPLSTSSFSTASTGSPVSASMSPEEHWGSAAVGVAGYNPYFTNGTATAGAGDN